MIDRRLVGNFRTLMGHIHNSTNSCKVMDLATITERAIVTKAGEKFIKTLHRHFEADRLYSIVYVHHNNKKEDEIVVNLLGGIDYGASSFSHTAKHLYMSRHDFVNFYTQLIKANATNTSIREVAAKSISGLFRLILPTFAAYIVPINKLHSVSTTKPVRKVLRMIENAFDTDVVKIQVGYEMLKLSVPFKQGIIHIKLNDGRVSLNLRSHLNKIS